MSHASIDIIGDRLKREVYNLGPALAVVNITMVEGTGLKELLNKQIHFANVEIISVGNRIVPPGGVVDRQSVEYWKIHYRTVDVVKPRDSPNHVLVCKVQTPVVLPCPRYAPLTGESYHRIMAQRVRAAGYLPMGVAMHIIVSTPESESATLRALFLALLEMNDEHVVYKTEK
jgi:hypothetical protein